MRITRGAGKPETVSFQAGALLEALDAFSESLKRMPFTQDLIPMLDVERQAKDGTRSPDETQLQGEEAIIRGALQVAASRLVSQELQEKAGRSEIQFGIRLIEEARQERLEDLAGQRVPATKGAGRDVAVARTRSVSPPKGSFRSTRQKKPE